MKNLKNPNFNCIVCHKKKFVSLSPDFSAVNNVLCFNCGLVFIPRKNTSMKNYYKEDGYFKKSPNIALRKWLVSKKMLINSAKERVNSSLKIKRVSFFRKNVLDIGCAYGELLFFVKNRYDSKVMGIEPSIKTVEYGKKMFSVPIKPLLLEEFRTKKRFDIILCCHTLEHVDEMNIFLKNIKRLLNKNGHVYIEVPNILRPTGGFTLKKFLYSEHLQTFSIYNLCLILNQNNITPIAYSDKDFLKIWCKKNIKDSINIPKISSEQIYSSLETYNSNYGILQHIRLYSFKFYYLLRLSMNKMSDIIGDK